MRVQVPSHSYPWTKVFHTQSWGISTHDSMNQGKPRKKYKVLLERIERCGVDDRMKETLLAKRRQSWDKILYQFGCYIKKRKNKFHNYAYSRNN
jgi:hypothetical protein